MDIETAIQNLDSWLDYEGESGRLDTDTITALGIIRAAAESYDRLMKATAPTELARSGESDA